MEREGQKMVPYFLIVRTFSLQISLLSGRREEEGRSAFLRDDEKKDDSDLEEDIFEAAGWVVGVSRCKNRLCPLGDCPCGRLVRRRRARCALRCRRIDDGLFLIIIIILLRVVRREPERARAVVRDENAEHRARRRVQSESWMANGVFGDVCETDAQVASRFHFLRRRAEEAEGTSKKKKSRKVYSNEGRGTPPPPIEKLRQLEAYAYAGNDFDIFDDTDKAVGRKAISILFTGRDGFINEQLARFRYCEIVVVTASFGAQDTLHRPVGADPSRYKQDNVCFVAFVDKPTIEKFGYQSGCFDVWNVVEYAHSGFSDSRMKARLVKALLPFHFPESKVTVWIDSKLELNKDATAVVDVLLRVNTHPKVTRVKRHVCFCVSLTWR